MVKILLPVDGSEHSRKALIEAKKLFGNSGNEFILLNVQGFFPELQGFNPRFVSGPKQEELENAANHVLDDMASELEDIDVSVEKRVLWGDPADQIIDYADAIKPDYIVMGSLGLTGLKRFLLGSVSSKVVSHARGSVIVVK